MEANSQVIVLERTDPSPCRHHWVIETANGPTSHGRCKRCGSERDFFNNVEDAPVMKEEPVEAH
jgi:hypothetical protein